jgi:hypothetical protein
MQRKYKKKRLWTNRESRQEPQESTQTTDHLVSLTLLVVIF